MATQPSRRPVRVPRLRRLLFLPAFSLATGALACASLPLPRSAPPTEPAAMTPSVSAPAASQGELRLTLAAGRYVRVAILSTPVDLVVRQHGPDGSPIEELRISGGGMEPARISWLIQAAGEYRWAVMPGEPTSPSARFAIWLEEERPAGPCDDARGRAERALLGGRRELGQPGEASAAKATSLLTSALTDWKEDGNAGGRVATLLASAEAELRRAHIAAAIEFSDRALVLARQLGDRQEEAKALQVHAQLLPVAEQLDSLEAAIELRQEVGDQVGMAAGLFSLGLYQQRKGENAQALISFKRALELQALNQDLRGEGWTLREIGVIHRNQADTALARIYLDLGLEFSLAGGDVIAEAMARSQSADLHLQNSELQAAYDEYTRAHQLLVAVGDRYEAAWALAGLANCLLHLGEWDKAREKHQEALAIFEDFHDQAARASALLGIGAAFEAADNLSGALANFQQALDVIRENGVHGWEAVALYDLGRAHRKLGLPAQAVPELEKALEVGAATSPANRAQILVELGSAYSQLRDLAGAERTFKEAIQLSLGGDLVEAAAQAGLARIERGRGDLPAARLAVGRALELTEKIRSEVIRDDQRISFLASRRAYYDLEVDLLMRLDRLQPGAGHGAAALAASEQARARSLLDLLDADRLELNQGIPPELKEQRKEIGERIARFDTQLRAAPLTLPKATVQRIETELMAAEEEEKSLGAEIRHRQATEAAFRASAPLPLQEIQSLLDEHTALLEFFLGSEGSYLFVVTRQGLATHQLPASQALKPLVDSLHSAVYQASRLGSRRYADDAFQLYRQLLLPAAGELEDKSRIIVVPDGFLYSLSFEALLTEPVPGAGAPQRNLPYLIRKLSVSYVPSASVLAHLLTERLPDREDRTRGKLFVGFAYPGTESSGKTVADSGCAKLERGRVVGARSAGSGSPPPLPAARDEVCRIAGLFKPAEAVVFVGPEATEENVKANAIVSFAHNLHFAVHGQLNEAHPDRSGLELGHSGSADDGLLQVREIMNLELHADLVVLSACQSGLGKEVSGEGLIGMTRAFLYAGAASLVVSLWPVDDESTADLMVHFYAHLEESGDKSEALRRAKLDLIDGSSYYHPYYWAPFVLVGRLQ